MMKLPGYLALALLLSFALPRDAAAQTADGPFYSRQHVVDYWVANPTSQAIEVFINGYFVHKAIGFGPFDRVQYFQCADGLLRTSCNTYQGPFAYQGAIHDFFATFPNGANLRLYLVNALIQPGASPLFGTYYYYRCYGDVSPFGGDVVNYIMLSHGSNIYGQVTGLSCLPRL